LAFRLAAGGFAVAVTLALGVAGAAAAPNAGAGTPGFEIIPAQPASTSPLTPATTEIKNIAPYAAPLSGNPSHEQAEDGPQTANVPTLAWVGEDVRLVACDDDIYPNPVDDPTIDFEQASWSSGGNGNIWTGDPLQYPAFDGTNATNLEVTNTGSAFFFPETTYRDEHRHGCVSATIHSLTAGLDEITLNVTDVTGHQLDPGTVYSEQFIVIWMTANAPKLTEASPTTISFPTTAGDNGTPAPSSQLTALGLTNLGNFLGDSANPGTFPSLDAFGDYVCSTATPPGNTCTFSNDEPITGDGTTANDVANYPPTYIPAGGLYAKPASPAVPGNNGLIDIKVTGSFPVWDDSPSTINEQYFSSVTGTTGPGTITLPNQWPALANLMATSSTQYTSDNTGNGALWDIHGSPTNTLATQGHAGYGPLNTSVTPNTGPGLCEFDGLPSEFQQATDVVDDCVSNGYGVGNPFDFSRVYGDVTTVDDTIGPYDPQAPNATLIPDGRLTTDDAPMPALPVYVRIAANSSLGSAIPAGYPVDPSKIGGIGGLYGISKWLIYSHDFDGSAAAPLCGTSGVGPACPTSTSALESDGVSANLYNPYYQEYIPSTLRHIEQASGITGVYEHGQTAGSGDDFPGFSNGDTDAYEFWKALDASSVDATQTITDEDNYTEPVSNGCLELDGTELPDNGSSYELLQQADANGDDPTNDNGHTVWVPSLPSVGGDENDSQVYYAQPDYPTQVLVYTDERGEAYVDYNPGDGFYNSVGVDGNSACDLQGLYGQPIGQSTISAQVEYPYEAVPYFPPAGANTLTKVVDSQWSKTLTVYPKNLVSSNSGVQISVVVAHAQNINGFPFSGEEVCLSAPSGIQIAYDDTPNLTPPVNTAGSVGTPGFVSSGSDCAYTGTAGNVAFDVSGSLNPTNVDVQALFVPEHIYRDVTIPVLGQTGTVTSTSPPSALPGDPVKTVVVPTGNDGSTGGSSNASPAAAAAPASTPSSPLPSVQAKVANVCKVESVRLHNSHGKYTVSFKLSCSSATTEAVTIRAYRANGKLLRTYRGTVATGRTVSVSIGRKVAHVTVTA
jgi:hypothetical protein